MPLGLWFFCNTLQGCARCSLAVWRAIGPPGSWLDRCRRTAGAAWRLYCISHNCAVFCIEQRNGQWRRKLPDSRSDNCRQRGRPITGRRIETRFSLINSQSNGCDVSPYLNRDSGLMPAARYSTRSSFVRR